MATLVWDRGQWDVDWWASPVEFWGQGSDWDWWVQLGRTRTHSLSRLVIEANWTTDSFTPGDGTWRGDLQPGRLTLRLIDRFNNLASIDKRAQIWCCHLPTGMAWCFFIATMSETLQPGRNTTNMQRVITGSTWAASLTTGSYNAGRPVETVSQRLAFIAGRWATDTLLYLPDVTTDFAADNHTVTAVDVPTGPPPAWLQLVRDAAANGTFWIEAHRDVTAGVGTWVLHYRLWDKVTYKLAPNQQVVVGTVTTQGIGNLVTLARWAGTNAAGVETAYDVYDGSYGSYGVLTYGPMRVWADLSQTANSDWIAVHNTSLQLFAYRAHPDVVYISSVSFVDAPRTGAPWNPALMQYNPAEVMTLENTAGSHWLVNQMTHRLTVNGWQADAAITRFVLPFALPAVTELEEAA